MKRREEIENAAKQKYPYKGGTKGMICEASIPIFIQGAEWADANPAWIRLVDEMPPIGVNVLTRVIKGDGTIVFQIDKRLEYEWLNLCHYDSISHWMKINFREE